MIAPTPRISRPEKCSPSIIAPVATHASQLVSDRVRSSHSRQPTLSVVNSQVAAYIFASRP